MIEKNSQSQISSKVLTCPFCQNYEISMEAPKDASFRYISPKELTAMAVKYRPQNNLGVAFTYNEPLIAYEYIRDTGKLLRENHMKTVVVTNGSASLQVLDEILPWVDAMNIDLKGFTQKYYQMLGGDLETVKDFIRHSAPHCHIELTTLIVPGENDSPEEIDALAAWVAGIRPDIPLHITRFFPRYKMTDRPATSISHIFRLKDIAEKHLKYVIPGNV